MSNEEMGTGKIEGRIILPAGMDLDAYVKSVIAKALGGDTAPEEEMEATSENERANTA